jgi:hypothetical protein
MTSEHYVEERNLSIAWAKGLRIASERRRREISPLVVSVTGFSELGAFEEEPRIRAALDAVLAKTGKQTVSTVANTIFPLSLWNRTAAREALFERYRRIAPRLRRASRKNSRGIYFERMICGGPAGKENQLDFAIRTYSARQGTRRSILQVATFDPTRDHSAAAQLGFPCLQQVSFAPGGGGLCVNAFYATQYLVERSYGNYVGLCRLGQFVAHELHLPLIRMTCLTGIGELDVAKTHLAGVLTALGDATK